MSTCLTGIKLLALDIGGVLADIDKNAIDVICRKAGLSRGEIFNADFWDLQKGLLNEAIFIDTMSLKLNISESHFKNAFVEILQVRGGRDFLANISLPYIFFSNINRLHYNHFLEQIDASSFAIKNSILSFEEKQLKPHAQFFQHLKKVMPLSPAEVLVIDDSDTIIASAQKFGFKAMLFDDSSSSLLFNQMHIQGGKSA